MGCRLQLVTGLNQTSDHNGSITWANLDPGSHPLAPISLLERSKTPHLNTPVSGEFWIRNAQLELLPLGSILCTYGGAAVILDETEFWKEVGFD